MKQNKLLYNIKKIASGEGFEPITLRDTLRNKFRHDPRIYTGEHPVEKVLSVFDAYNEYAPNFLQNKSKTKAYQLGQTLRSDIWRENERARNLEKYRKQGVPEDLLRSRLQTSRVADGVINKNPDNLSLRDRGHYLAALVHDKDFKQGQMDQDRLIAHNKTRRDNIAYQNSWRGKLENAGKSLFNKLRNLGK